MQAVRTACPGCWPRPALAGRAGLRIGQKTCRDNVTRRQCSVRAQDAEGELESPDWDQELKIFKQRLSKPSQLAVQAQLAAEKVDVGRVSCCHHRCRRSPRPEACLLGLPMCLRGQPPLAMLQVLYAKDNVAIIEGLNNDADVGTCLAFSSGARG